MRPIVVLRPGRTHQDAGMRTEPPVSVPMPNGAIRAATATAVPYDEPPGVLAAFRSQRFHGEPIGSLLPQQTYPTPPEWDLPSEIVPPAINFCTIVPL